jgi:hypothetical protein
VPSQRATSKASRGDAAHDRFMRVPPLFSLVSRRKRRSMRVLSIFRTRNVASFTGVSAAARQALSGGRCEHAMRLRRRALSLDASRNHRSPFGTVDPGGPEPPRWPLYSTTNALLICALLVWTRPQKIGPGESDPGPIRRAISREPNDTPTRLKPIAVACSAVKYEAVGVEEAQFLVLNTTVPVTVSASPCTLAMSFSAQWPSMVKSARKR